MASLFKTDIQFLRGVGDKRAKLFRKIGAPTIGALLCLYPRNYEDWSNPYSIADAPIGHPCCIKATVVTPVSKNFVRNGITLYKLKVCDQVSTMLITFFNNHFAASKLKVGDELLFYGKVGGTISRKEMISPIFESSISGKRLRPIYPQTAGLSSRQIETAVKQAFSMLPKNIKDPIPSYILEKYGLCDLRFAMDNVHFPKDMASLEIAKKRLIFEELLVLQLGMINLKGGFIKEKTSVVVSNDYSDEFYSMLTFAPTNAQKRVISECIEDMKKNDTPMSRLVQGDVGSGKTAVAAALCYSIIKNGFQTAFMAPTEILAEQHYQSLTKMFEGTNIKVALLTGSTRAKAKRRILDELSFGMIDLIIGTHSLISDGVEFKNLGLVVTDEQHRFGVSQRAKLAEKGANPHMLVMSATPIPRTLALIIYGDLDISILDELPPGRQRVDTYHITGKKRARSFELLKRLIDEGRQCYIVCPLVEEGENNMIAAEQYAEKLKNTEFSNYRVGLIHGRMDPSEKDRVMSEFVSGNIDVLVSTTVIEVGVNVPNAVVMLVENAERFGLSQLHQLRGRVGRGEHKSYCILISDAQNEQTIKRLSIMTQTNDGFKIADEDLRLRGPGDFFGSRQHGLPNLKIANMVSDVSLLAKAQEATQIILERDPLLESPENKGLKAEINRLFIQIGQQGLN